MRIFVASRLRPFVDTEGRLWSVDENIIHAKLLVREIALLGHEPYAPQAALADGVLDDHIPEERAVGIRVGQAWLRCAGELWVDDSRGVSTGMEAEISLAREFGIPIRWRSLGW